MESQPSSFSVLACQRCHAALTLHSTQIVTTSQGRSVMDVFECSSCEQLEAREKTDLAA